MLGEVGDVDPAPAPGESCARCGLDRAGELAIRHGYTAGGRSVPVVVCPACHELWLMFRDLRLLVTGDGDVDEVAFGRWAADDWAPEEAAGLDLEARDGGVRPWVADLVIVAVEYVEAVAEVGCVPDGRPDAASSAVARLMAANVRAVRAMRHEDDVERDALEPWPRMVE